MGKLIRVYDCGCRAYEAGKSPSGSPLCTIKTCKKHSAWDEARKLFIRKEENRMKLRDNPDTDNKSCKDRQARSAVKAGTPSLMVKAE